MDTGNFEAITSASIYVVTRKSEESDQEEADFLPPPPKIKCCQEAIQSLKDVQAFLETRSFFD